MHSVAQRVILNSVIIYIKMVLNVFISLYTVRITLNSMGETDYGIFNLIAGVVAVLSFIKTAFSISTQRFLSFNLGRKDKKQQAVIFFNSLLVHFFIGIIISIIMIFLGSYLFGGFLNIPTERLMASKYLYYFMIINIFITIMTAPFIATINAHEQMIWVAIVNILELGLKLVAAIQLNVINYDKLIFFGAAITLISFISFILFFGITINRYEEVKEGLSFANYNKKVFKSLYNFIGWNMIGSTTSIAKTQGLSILFNRFFGPSINASYGIANQVGGQVSFFSHSLFRAINPQIMKSEGEGNREKMIKFSQLANKSGFIIMAVIIIPLIFEIRNILNLWLIEVPENTILFCIYILAAMLVNQITLGLDSAIQAFGKLKLYMLVVGSIKLMILPVGFFLLHAGITVKTVLLIYVVIELLSGIARIYIVKIQVEKNIFVLFSNFLKGISFPLFVLLGSLVILTEFFKDYPYRFFFTIPVAAILFFLAVIYTGLDQEEKTIISRFFQSLNIFKKKASKILFSTK